MFQKTLFKWESPVENLQQVQRKPQYDPMMTKQNQNLKSALGMELLDF